MASARAANVLAAVEDLASTLALIADTAPADDSARIRSVVDRLRHRLQTS